MRHLLRRPKGALQGFVDLLWFYEGHAHSHAMERLLPEGGMELVINLSEDEIRVYNPRDTSRFERLDGGVLVGAHSEFFVIDTSSQQSVMGVHFRPGGAFPFVALPADELHGLQVSLRDLWGGFACELRERLLAIDDPAARLDLLEAALLSRLARPLAHHPAVGFALRELHGAACRSVGDITQETGLSARRFIQLFRQQVGMAPKLFSRVRRFQHVIRHLPPAGAVDWADVAAGAGYFDQAHLIHDFRALSGISPGTYAALRTEHTNHVPLTT